MNSVFLCAGSSSSRDRSVRLRKRVQRSSRYVEHRVTNASLHSYIQHPPFLPSFSLRILNVCSVFQGDIWHAHCHANSTGLLLPVSTVNPMGFTQENWRNSEFSTNTCPHSSGKDQSVEDGSYKSHSVCSIFLDMSRTH